MTSREWLPQQAAFEFVRRGYSPEQVNEYLDRLEYDLRILTADRDTATHRLAEVSAQFQAAHSEADELRNQLDRTALTPTSMSGLSERMQRMIRLAEEEASEIRARAQADMADQQADLEKRIADQAEARRAFDNEREKARAQLAQHVKDLTDEAKHDSEQVRAQASHQAAGIIAAAQAEAQRLAIQSREHFERVTQETDEAAAAAAVERARLDTESHTRRTEVEEDFTIAITARRAQAHQYVAEQESESKQQAEELVAAATAEAQRLVADATAESQRLVDEATTEAQLRVSLAAQESHRRVAEADAAVDQLVDLRYSVLTQVASLEPIIDQLHREVDHARATLAPRSDEATKPAGRDFPEQVGPLDFDTLAAQGTAHRS